MNFPSHDGESGYGCSMGNSRQQDGGGGAAKPLLLRRTALDVLAPVLDRGVTVPAALARHDRLSRLDRDRIGFLVESILRGMGRADAVIDGLVGRRPHPRGMNVLRLGTVEIRLLGARAEPAVDLAVRLMRSSRATAHLAGMANAVLRKVAGEAGERLWRAAPPGRLPGWIRQPAIDAYGEDAVRSIEAVHEMLPPLDLTPASPAMAPKLAEDVGALVLPTGSLRLHRRSQVSGLPGYGDGSWWVQDAAAAIPVRMLGDVDGLDVLDMCAAPGGKTMQLAAAGARMVAIEKSPPRLERMRDNLRRTGLAAELVLADARGWGGDREFDAVLVDAPCSSTGIIRRDPDVALQGGDAAGRLASLGQLQLALLERAVRLTRKGGRILYCVCSLLPSEGEEMAVRAARELALEIVATDPASLGVNPGWQTAEGGVRTRPDYWPEAGGLDGFYAVVFRKP